MPLTPHHANGLAIIAEVPQVGSVEKMMNILTSGFVANWFLVLSIGVLCFGHAMWALERWSEPVDGLDNPQFPLSLTQGGQEGKNICYMI